VVNLFIGVTDGDWFSFLAAQPQLEKVNFWQPGGSTNFKALQSRELFLFKLHSPRNYIVGGGGSQHDPMPAMPPPPLSGSLASLPARAIRNRKRPILSFP
jgi:hypothetical protein